MKPVFPVYNLLSYTSLFHCHSFDSYHTEYIQWSCLTSQLSGMQVCAVFTIQNPLISFWNHLGCLKFSWAFSPLSNLFMSVWESFVEVPQTKSIPDVNYSEIEPSLLLANSLPTLSWYKFPFLKCSPLTYVKSLPWVRFPYLSFRVNIGSHLAKEDTSLEIQTKISLVLNLKIWL